jgi:hypothetical protein
MRRLSILLGAALLLPLISFISPESGDPDGASTWGSFSFTVKTITDNGTYSPKHVMAIWIKDSNGNFVKSLKVCANQRKQYLYTWIANSGQNSTDAITSATLSSHTTHTVLWNCTNTSGVQVPDGTYKVSIEYTDKHAQGPTAEFSFVKGPNPQSQTPANQSYFQNISLQFTPAGVGFEETLRKGGLQVFPNPSTGPFQMMWAGELQEGAVMRVFDLRGSLVHEEEVDPTAPLQWDAGSSGIDGGIYLMELSDGQGNAYRSRVMVLR